MLAKKDKAKVKYCPHCGQVLEKSVIRFSPGKFIVDYSCPNDCLLTWNDFHLWIDDETDSFIFYEDDLNKDYDIIALIGEAGSGKDRTLKEILSIAPHFNEIISCTTRPIREGEKNGVNYYYYSPEKFQQKIENKEMLEYTVFNDWYYGTGLESLDKSKINVGVFNPAGIRALLARGDCNVKVFWISVKSKTRLLRQLNREENPNVDEIIRRYNTDKKDFEAIDFDFISLSNNHPSDLRDNAEWIVSQCEGAFAQGQN